MQNLKKITKEEAVSKFGKHFSIVNAKNKHGYIIQEVLGFSSNNMFKTDNFYKTSDEASVALINLIKDNSTEIIEYYAELSKSLRSKWILFSHKKGWLKGTRAKTVSENLERLEKAKNNINVQSNDLIINMLPKIMYIPEFYIEIDKEYYQFIHSNTMQHENRLITYKVSNISFNVDNDSNIIMDSDFVSTSDTEDTQRLNHHSLIKFNGDYLTFNYSNCYLFFDKDKCLQFARTKIEEEINNLQNILKEFS